MTAFSSLETLAGRTLLSVFGETAIVRPRILSGYGPASADAERPAILLRGLFTTQADTFRLMESRRGAAQSAALTSDRPQFWVPASQAGPGRDVKDGDDFELPQRGRTFTIIAVLRGLNGDLTLTLGMTEAA